MIPLGRVEGSADKPAVPVRVFPPGNGTKQEAAVIEIPIISSVGVQLPRKKVPQLRVGRRLDYALANRDPEPVEVHVETRWTKGASNITSRCSVTLQPGETRSLSTAAAVPNAGPWKLTVTAAWSGGSETRSILVDLYDVNLPADFRVEAVDSMTLSMDIFNSLGGQWAGKPVSINGIEIGVLPVTGQTLRWHEGLTVSTDGARAKKVLVAGLRPNGDIELKPVVNNKVKNCFKVRNVQATIHTKSGEQFKTARVSNVNCSDDSWLYSEGACVRNGRPVPLGTLRFIRKGR